MRTYALGRSDGGVSIMRCFGDATPENELSKWPAAAAAAIVEIREIDPARIPADRTHRDAWTVDLTVDAVKAAAIDQSRAQPDRIATLEARLATEAAGGIDGRLAALEAKVAALEARTR